MKRLSLLLASFFLTLLVAAQTYQGRVVSAEDNIPIPFAHLLNVSSGQRLMANEDGEFLFDFPADSLRLEATAMGHRKRSLWIYPDRPATFRLAIAEQSFPEATVIGISAKSLFQKALEAIPHNYSQTPILASYFYRAQRLDTLQNPVYAEECYFQVKKDYSRRSKESIYLVHNRNFDLSDAQYAFQGMALQDYVHEFARRKLPLSQPTFSQRVRQDGQTLYALRFQRKGAPQASTVWIDSASLAFVRFDAHDITGRRHQVTEYKRIGQHYQLYSVQFTYRWENRPPTARFVTLLDTVLSSFSRADIIGRRVTKREMLRDYYSPTAAHRDSLFWRKHALILPDSTLRAHIARRNAIPLSDTVVTLPYIPTADTLRLYTPHLTAAYATDAPTLAIAQTNVALNAAWMRATRRWADRPFWSLLRRSLWAYLLTSTLEMRWADHRFAVHHALSPTLASSYKALDYDKHDIQAIENFRFRDHNSFLRLHNVRNEYRYLKMQTIAEQVMRADMRNFSNRFAFARYYLPMVIAESFRTVMSTRSHNESVYGTNTLIIDRNRSWVYYLHRPEAEFVRNVGMLTNKEEEDYLRRASLNSFINLLSPLTLTLGRCPLDEGHSLGVHLSFVPTPLGGMNEQQIFLMTRSRLHQLALREFAMHKTTGFSLGYKIYDLPLGSHLRLNANADLWSQPRTFLSSTHYLGARIGAQLTYRLPYTRFHHFYFTLGYDHKSKGYLPDRLNFGAGGNLSARLSMEY